MSEFDVRKSKEEVTAINWNEDGNLRLVPVSGEHVCFAGDSLECIADAEEARNLIKALEKAIELEWLK